MEPVVSTINLSLAYGDGWFNRDKKALEGLSVSVNSGNILGILGGNGSGKSTFLKVLAGLLPRYSGEVLISGVSPRAAVAANRVGFVPEKPNFSASLQLRQFLRYQGRLSGLRDELEDRVTRCLQQCRLEDQEDLKIGVLSKGAIQRLAMAQALVHDPDVLLLDEPLDGLDPLARNRFQTLIQELADEGKCILLATHLMEGLEDFCDEMIVLHEGKTLFQGAPRFDAGLEGWIVETLKAREAAGG